MTEQALQIYLLGDFRLVVRDRSVTKADWRKRKARMLVQILALQRSKSMRRDQLVELLFPDADAKSANENFYRAVYAARHALGPGLPTHAPSRYLIADGLNNQAIGEHLFLSEHTVHRHIANILNKLSVSSRAAAVAQAARRGIL